MNFLDQLIERVVADKPSEVIESLIHSLPEDREEAIAGFCDQFELGNWFYEALIENRIDITEELEKIRVNKQLDEELIVAQSWEADRDYRASNGWLI